MNKISVAELAKAVSTKYGITQDTAENFVTEFFNVIDNGLRTDKTVKVRGFGTFKVVDVRERESVNVNTGERVTIEGHGKINFIPDPIMRDLVNKPFAKFDTVILNEGVDIEELNKVDEEQPIEYTDERFDTEAENAYEPMQDEPFTAIELQPKEPEQAVVEPVESIANDEETTLIKQNEPETGNEKTSILSEEPISDNEPEEESEDDEPSFFRRNHALISIVATILIAATAFAGGYLLGQKMASRPVFKTIKVYNVMKQKATVDTIQAVDTVKNALDGPKKHLSDNITKNKETIKKTDKTTEEPTVSAQKQAGSSSAALDLAKRQVKTGAYSITGTAQTTTVRKGQTLKSISKFYLGDGMECYIQVHNNVGDISEGMKIKIPQLKLKRH